MSTATETAEIGRVPPGPHRLSSREWIDVFKRTFKEFIADDAMGLSQQIAYSSLLAFFPSLIFLVGLLGLFDAYDDLQTFLVPVAPEAVVKLIGDIQRTARGQRRIAPGVPLRRRPPRSGPRAAR